MNNNIYSKEVHGDKKKGNNIACHISICRPQMYMYCKRAIIALLQLNSYAGINV